MSAYRAGARQTRWSARWQRGSRYVSDRFSFGFTTPRRLCSDDQFCFCVFRIFSPCPIRTDHGHLRVRLLDFEETKEILYVNVCLDSTKLLMRQWQPSRVIVVVERQRHQEEKDGGRWGEVDGVIDVLSFDDLSRRRNVALYRSSDVVPFDELSATVIFFSCSTLDTYMLTLTSWLQWADCSCSTADKCWYSLQSCNRQAVYIVLLTLASQL